MHLMLQPALGMELLGDKTMLDQGFLSRMLIVYPGSIDAKPFRDPVKEEEETLATYTAWAALCLSKPQLNFVQGRGMFLSPQ